MFKKICITVALCSLMPIAAFAATATSTAGCAMPLGTLFFGMHGGGVSCLQQLLADEDSSIYPEGLVTGYFGRFTELALQRWQQAHGIVMGGSATSTGWGIFGPRSRDYLFGHHHGKVATSTPGMGGGSSGMPDSAHAICVTPWGSRGVASGDFVTYQPYFSNGTRTLSVLEPLMRCSNGSWQQCDYIGNKCQAWNTASTTDPGMPILSPITTTGSSTSVADSCVTPWGNKTVSDGRMISSQPYFSNGQFSLSAVVQLMRCNKGAWQRCDYRGNDCVTNTQ